MSFVLKRDNRKEEFEVEKIKKVISWATQDLGVNPLVLESKFDEFICEGISTTDIQANLIYHARILCSPEIPEWSVVAGRLNTMVRWKSTNIFEKTFSYYMQEQMDNGIYAHPGLKKWTKNEIKNLGKHIVQERDLDHSYGSVLTAHAKYLVDNECIQQMHMVNAMIIASVEDREYRLKVTKQIYDALSLRKISLATPWLSNLRRNKNISSCFIIGVDDDINSIFDNIKNAALISKNGGGLGIDMSRIRAKGAMIDGRAASSKGVTSWSKIFNDVAVAVDQGGRRAGAFTVHVPIWHRDIEDFLEIQTENGDFRKKSFDIFPQVGLMDLFMKEIIKDDGGTWYTFCPHEVKQVLDITLPGLFGKDFAVAYKKCIAAYNQKKLLNVGMYTARDLLKSIMRVQFETGLPYLIFLDRINEFNPNSHKGYIPCANLCTESYSNVEPGKFSHTCNLCSVVVGRMETDQEVIDTAALCARILDNGIQLTKPPIQESLKHNETYRTIGIGILGLHDYVAQKDLTWDAYKEFTKLAELIEYGAVSESVGLAKDRGKYPVFEGSKWDTGELMERFAKNSVSGDIVDWEKLTAKMKKNGIRNSQLTSPAPNTSTSVFMDATPGIMPSYAGFYNEDNKTGKFSVYGMYIKEHPLSYEMTAARQDQTKLAKMVGALQQYCDTGISAEYLFDQNNENFSAKSLFDLIVAAWKEKTKAIYYIRSLKKGETIDNIINAESVCVSCSG